MVHYGAAAYLPSLHACLKFAFLFRSDTDIHSCWTFNQSFLCYSTGDTFDWMANTQHNVGHSFSTSTVESNSANSSYTASDNVSQDCVTQTLEKLCYRHTLFCFNSFKTSECLDYNFEYSCNADICIYYCSFPNQNNIRCEGTLTNICLRGTYSMAAYVREHASASMIIIINYYY